MSQPSADTDSAFFSRLLCSREAFFEQRHIIGIAVLLALLISLPMLFNGIFLDDYAQRIKLLTGDTNIFDNFGYGETLIPSGELPWWLHPDTRIVFFRPLAAWLTRFDYALFPNTIWLMHLHSVLWYGALVAVAGLVYRTLMPMAWAAGLAVILFAVDAHHAGAVQWLCNRNVLLSLMCGLLSLYCHQARFPAQRWCAALLFALALTAGESALAMSGYLLAYEVFLSKENWGQRFLRLLPYGLIGIAYLGFWRQGGYGTFGPGFYIDPGHNPLLFLQEMLFRVPAYLASQYVPPPAEALGLLEDPKVRDIALYPALGYVLAMDGLLAWFFWPLLRHSATARFYALGMMIALLPLSGITMVSRVLWYVGFGATGLLALYVQAWRQNEPGVRARRYSRIFLGAMLILHLWLSPLFYLVSAEVPDLLDQQWDTQVVKLPNAVGQNRKILLLSSQNYIVNVTFPLLKDKAYSLGSAPTRPQPAISEVFALAEGEQPYSVSRPDAETLVLQSSQGLKTLRLPGYGFKAGEVVHYENVVIEIVATTTTGVPTEIRYRFKPGTLAAYEVMAWQHDHFVPARLPELGHLQGSPVDELKTATPAPDRR